MVGGLPTSTVNGFAVHPTNPKVMYVAMRDGIFRSEDGGTKWSRVDGGIKGVAALTVNLRTPPEVYAVTMEGRLFRSPDGGARWHEVHRP